MNCVWGILHIFVSFSDYNLNASPGTSQGVPLKKDDGDVSGLTLSLKKGLSGLIQTLMKKNKSKTGRQYPENINSI